MASCLDAGSPHVDPDDVARLGCHDDVDVHELSHDVRVGAACAATASACGSSRRPPSASNRQQLIGEVTADGNAGRQIPPRVADRVDPRPLPRAVPVSPNPVQISVTCSDSISTSNTLPGPGVFATTSTHADSSLQFSRPRAVATSRSPMCRGRWATSDRRRRPTISPRSQQFQPRQLRRRIDRHDEAAATGRIEAVPLERRPRRADRGD